MLFLHARTFATDRTSISNFQWMWGVNLRTKSGRTRLNPFLIDNRPGVVWKQWKRRSPLHVRDRTGNGNSRWPDTAPGIGPRWLMLVVIKISSRAQFSRHFETTFIQSSILKSFRPFWSQDSFDIWTSLLSVLGLDYQLPVILMQTDRPRNTLGANRPRPNPIWNTPDYVRGSRIVFLFPHK